jgi:lipoate-protein ligase B
MKALQNCRVLDLGLVDYEIVHDLQKKIVEDVIVGRAPQTLVTCEHPHVITLSRRANKRHILASDAQLKKMGVGICITDRGGEVTYHGPGQLVLYPIFDLRKDKKDLHLFLRRLEEVVIRALRSNFGLNALRKKGMTGVWVGPYKVASIGIGVRHWVSYHGLSLNVKADNKFFNLIKPCGLDVKMASLNDFFSDGVSLDAVKVMLLESIEDVFGFKLKGGMGK